MPDEYIKTSLTPFGRVVSVQHLTVQGFPNIRTGTRMVSMSLLKPIPPELTISNFKCAIKYRGQPKFCFGWRSFGHFARLCPRASGGAKAGSATAGRTMAEAVSTGRSSVVSQAPVQPSSLPATASADGPVPDGAAPSQDYVSPSTALSCHAVAMDVSSHESVRAADEPSISLDMQVVGLSIHLSDFKEHVTFSGDFSYSRRVSSFKRVAKTQSPDRADARRIIRARRLEAFAICRNQDVVSVVADTSVEMSVVSMQQHTVPVDSPAVVTSNRNALLADEADELAAPEPVSSVVVPVENHLQPSCTNSAISDAPADSTDVSTRAHAVVDDLASLAGTSLIRSPVLCLPMVLPSRSEQSAEPVASLPSPVSGAVEPSPAGSPVTHTPALAPWQASGSAASPAAGSAYALAVLSRSSSLLPFRESPDLFSPASSDSEGRLTTPSNFPVSPVSSHYARSFFSEVDDPPSLLPSASEQVDVLADQSLVSLFNNNNNV
ncbi:Hypothetical predicted protein [Paramuricea clavata]|uniref:Uncharacterized protein n=1 Tax=Paramuricea clavata TaxID=317549 RepID=A0A7D9EFQ4_PARCT|nr:Hypothetical predicted protein [Paramuricea clavata]